MRLKPRTAASRVSSSGIGSVFSDSTVTSASCTSRRHAGELLDPHDRAALHRPVDRAGHQRGGARAFGEQPGVVPAVAQRLLGRAGGALHQQRGVAADRGGEVLAHPGLGRAGHAEQQQRPVGGERGDGDLDQPPLADVLGRDDGAVGQRAAEQVGDDRPRRQPPARRPFTVVERCQRREFVRVLVLGVGTQHVGGGCRCSPVRV